MTRSHGRPSPASPLAPSGVPLRALAFRLSLFAFLALPACSNPLFSPEKERTQYDRYDAVRNQYAQQYTEDAYGRKQPNLRARLLPKY